MSTMWRGFRQLTSAHESQQHPFPEWLETGLCCHNLFYMAWKGLSLHNNVCSSFIPRCVALHSYIAHGPDELELQKGEGVRVLGKYYDGWLRGMSLVTGRVGIFPSNYVAPLFRSDFLMWNKIVAQGVIRVGNTGFSHPSSDMQETWCLSPEQYVAILVITIHTLHVLN